MDEELDIVRNILPGTLNFSVRKFVENMSEDAFEAAVKKADFSIAYLNKFHRQGLAFWHHDFRHYFQAIQNPIRVE